MSSSQEQQQKKTRNFRKRPIEEVEEANDKSSKDQSDDEEESRRLALEEVKFLQRQRERKSGIPAIPASQKSAAAARSGAAAPKTAEKNDGDGEKEDLVLQDTFAQETAVMVEDPNMLKYVEQELAKKRGQNVSAPDQLETELKRVEDELYKVPEHLKVKKRSSEEGSTQWTTGIAEIQLPIEYKLKNIEETEAAKKLLQEKRLMGRPKSNLNIPASYSADYFQRGKDYAEKLRREHPELYKDRRSQEGGGGGGGGEAKPTENKNKNKNKNKNNNNNNNNNNNSESGGGQRQAATDQFMLERFRRRERNRGMRR